MCLYDPLLSCRASNKTRERSPFVYSKLGDVAFWEDPPSTRQKYVQIEAGSMRVTLQRRQITKGPPVAGFAAAIGGTRKSLSLRCHWFYAQHESPRSANESEQAK